MEFRQRKPTSEEIEAAQKRLLNIAEMLENTASELAKLSCDPVLFDGRNAGKMMAYAEVVHSVYTNMCQEFELYG